MSRIDKINVGGTDYEILPANGQNGQVLAIVNGQVVWTDASLDWEEL